MIPERIFHAAIGDLFTIRVAGNVIDDHQLGSIEYAAGHLGTKLVVVLGHTQCGAVHAAIDHDPSGFIKYITDSIKAAIGKETDDYKATVVLTLRSDAGDEIKMEVLDDDLYKLNINEGDWVSFDENDKIIKEE